MAGLAWTGLQVRSKGGSARGGVLRLGTLGGATVLATTSSWLMCAGTRLRPDLYPAPYSAAGCCLTPDGRRLCCLLPCHMLRTACCTFTELSAATKVCLALTATVGVRRFILFTKFPGDSCTWCLTSALLSLSILVTATRGFSGRSAP